ncbi:MAG: hypothetical protein L0H96_00225 [Humibacillus sp.]|nr:hypothetical protein [Humibacillus sp.]MDN5775322.1 hypothetical protein [Humibacillus sp.]
MVAHLVRLKLTLLRNMLRRSRAQAIGVVLAIVYFGFIVVALAFGVASLRADLDLAVAVIPVVGAVAVVLWSLVPLFSFGSDPTLDPGRFATFAVPPRQLAIGLIAGALVGLPVIATMLIALGVMVAWSHTVLSTVVGAVSTAVGVLTAVTMSRWVTAVATSALSSRRGKDVMGVLALILLVLFSPVLIALSNAGGDVLGVARSVSTVAGWTPLGWAWAAPGDIALGHVALGLLRLALALGFLWVLGRLWLSALTRLVENPRSSARPGAATVADGDLGLLDRGPDTVAAAVAMRVLIYWWRDPRYQAGMLLTPFVPLALLVPYFTADIGWVTLLMAPLLAFLMAWGEHNAVAYEADAFWMHVAAGTPGQADRRGRLVPSVLIATPLVSAYAVAGAWLAGRFDLLPAVLGLSAALLGAGYAVSSVLSIVMPYPVAKPGESPFATPPGATGITLVAQLVAAMSSVLLAAPPIVLALLAWSGAGWAVAATAVVGLAWGVLLFEVGVRVGGRIYERRSPELLMSLTAN